MPVDPRPTSEAGSGGKRWVGEATSEPPSGPPLLLVAEGVDRAGRADAGRLGDDSE